jgi:hypothetical protein
VIAKYRKDGNTREWWLTNFTMEQVEGRIVDLEATYNAVYATLQIEQDKVARLRRALTIIEDRHHPASEWCDEAKEVLK